MQKIFKVMKLAIMNLVLWMNFKRYLNAFLVPAILFIPSIGYVRLLLGQDEVETENAAEAVSVQQEQIKAQAELEQEHDEIDPQSKAQQYIPRRTYQNQRGGRGGGGGGGGGRRGYSNGRGGRGSGRGNGSYQNGRNQYYEQPGNYYPKNFYNNRGRGGRGGGQAYNSHGSAVQGGHAPADVGVHS